MRFGTFLVTIEPFYRSSKSSDWPTAWFAPLTGAPEAAYAQPPVPTADDAAAGGGDAAEDSPSSDAAPDTGVETERAGPSAEQVAEVKLAETDLTLGFDTRVRRNFTGGVSGRHPQLLHLQPQRRQQLGSAVVSSWGLFRAPPFDLLNYWADSKNSSGI